MSARPEHVIDWNAVACAGEGEFRAARRLLEHWGAVGRTGYYNVLAVRLADPEAFLEDFARRLEAEPGLRNTVSRAMVCRHTFGFQSREEFEARAREAVLAWAPALEGQTFHVRMHRRGFRKALSSLEEEHYLDGALLEELEARGRPGRITFDDPDAVVAVETVGGRAGLSLWTREDLRRYPFLGVD